MQKSCRTVYAAKRARFLAALWHALDFVADGRLIKGALAEPRIIFGTPTTGWMPKEKQVGTPLVSYAPLTKRRCEWPRNELERPSLGAETVHPLSETSSPILGEFAAAEAAPTSKNRYPDCCPDLAESESIATPRF